jgi:hypothetical protein
MNERGRGHSQGRSLNATLPTIYESGTARDKDSGITPAGYKRTARLISSNAYADTLVTKAQLIAKDRVKVPPVLVKLRQKRLEQHPSTPSKFPSIDKILDRLKLKALDWRVDEGESKRAACLMRPLSCSNRRLTPN